jgi:hypothetical protein
MSEIRIRHLRQGYADDYQGDGPPDLGPLRALAEREELTDAVSRLADGYGRPLPDGDLLAPLAGEVARALTEAGSRCITEPSTIRYTGSAGCACCRSPAAMISAAGEGSWCLGRRPTCCRSTGIGGRSITARTRS